MRVMPMIHLIGPGVPVTLLEIGGVIGTTAPDANGGTMKIVLDRPRCEGHGLCEEAAPRLMHLDDDGDLVLDVEEVHDPADVEAAKAAVRVCPVAALRAE